MARVPARTTTRRYAPIAAAAVVVAGAILLFGRGGDHGGARATGAAATGDELIRSGPMTPQRAKLVGATGVDFGPRCDPATGRIKLPSVYAPPCVVPFRGGNGGATTPGVTPDRIEVVAYIADPTIDPLVTAALGGSQADLAPERQKATYRAFADLYNRVFETYGRRVHLDFYIGTGASGDEAAAKADALAIADRRPFAVIGGPLQESPVFADEIAAHGILCLQNCALALPDDFVAGHAPFVWTDGLTPGQSSQLAAEAIGKLVPPGPARLAGDAATRARPRVYGLVHYDTVDGLHESATRVLRDGLAAHDIEPAADVPYQLDLARLQEGARTIVARLTAKRVTTVLLYGDALTIGALSTEAARQGFHPEWVLGPTTAGDVNQFARGFDQGEWRHAFGLGLSGTASSDHAGTAYQVYRWAYGRAPAGKTYNSVEPALRTLFTGVQLAGARLTPETFRDGLFRFPPSGGGPTRPRLSWGDHGAWPGTDYGGVDDASLVWWDPAGVSVDELGRQGPGSYRFTRGGARYTRGRFPASPEAAGLFEAGDSVIELDATPPRDTAPAYPAPRS